MTPRVYLEIQSLRDEVALALETLSRVQGRLEGFATTIGEDLAETQARINELESKNEELSNTTKQLQVQNTELERGAAQRVAEVEDAVNARRSDLRKLRHARKVIRDLVDEKETLQALNTDVLDKEGHPTSQKDLGLESKSGSIIDDATSTSSETHAAVTSYAEEAYVDREIKKLPQDVPAELPTDLMGPASLLDFPSLFTDPSGWTAGPSNLAPEIVGTPVQPTPDSSPHDQWTIQYSKPPSSTKQVTGPLSWGDLPKRLQMDEEMVYSLESITQSQDHSLRLQMVNRLAFVYDPIILESGSVTYLVDWAPQKTNDMIKKYISQKSVESHVFHTFFFPIKKKGWYYIGDQTWTVVDLWPVWQTLGEQSRLTLTSKLHERCPHMDQPEITRQLDSGDLTQLCVQISGKSHVDASREFTLKMGYELKQKGTRIPKGQATKQ